MKCLANQLLKKLEYNMVAALSLGANQYSPFSLIEADKLIGKHFRLKQNTTWSGDNPKQISIPAYSNHNGAAKLKPIIISENGATSMLKCHHCGNTFEYNNTIG